MEYEYTHLEDFFSLSDWTEDVSTSGYGHHSWFCMLTDVSLKDQRSFRTERFSWRLVGVRGAYRRCV